MMDPEYKQKLDRYQETFFGAKLQQHLPGIVELSNIGCCPRCTFRFANQRNLAIYQEKSEFLKDLVENMKQTYAASNSTSNETTSSISSSSSDSISPSSSDSSSSSSVVSPSVSSSDSSVANETNKTTTEVTTEVTTTTTTTDPTPAKSETKYCIACLGILDSATSPEFTNWVIEKLSNTGTTGMYKAGQPDEVVDVKEGLKWILGPMLARRLGLTFKNGADFTAAITFKHAESEDEHLFLSQLDDTVKPRKNKKQAWKEDLAWDSLNSMTRTLKKLNPETFKKHGYCPPKAVSTPATYELVHDHAAVFIAGRYNKLDRNISQTPWLIDGAPKSTSVDEHIAPTIKEYFNCDEVRFSASGREDIDVRMLGDGRPFMLELVNARRVFHDFATYRQMEEKINNSLSLSIKVNRLQRISKSLTKKLKDGEEQKRKTYRAVVWVEKAVEPADLEFVNNIKDLEISQQTPVRVLHRRSLATRKRSIHWIKYEYINKHFLVLDLCTQAGTYVKEFVHGDLGRTTPNFGSLLGCNADILQLDVLSIEFDFPPVPNPNKKPHEF